MFDRREVLDLRPHLERRYPLKRSAHYDDGFADAVTDWFLSYDLLPGESERATLRRTNFSYVAGVCWPTADRRRLFDLACLTMALNVRDHEFDAYHRGRVEALTSPFLADLENGFTTRTDRRWSPVFADIRHRFHAYLPERSLRRLDHAIAEYLHGCITYDRNLLQRGRPRDTEQYLRWRHTTVGQHIDHRMIEISLGIDLPDHVLDDPRVRALCDLDVRRTILAQDILSVKKELLDHEQENIVAVIALSRHCPLRDALDHATILYRQNMDLFDHIHRALAGSRTCGHDRTRRWLDALDDFHAGLLDWSTGSSRYTLLPESTWSTPDMIV
ncbi:hypothetical protein SAMN05216188_11929 [Lentzea xinjiangensis]|uniref:Terpene synthase n=1 Tax=Lentzea xinjiangensis TaxID=402600 RepID=A0A1H9TRQ4_9PSEU|nr:hypothetical protein [Lentzea xinjiangensis]SER99812.1 hypothetical protein SAMN05216188_11929 [Lentzea xinjiangensis]